MQTLLKSTKNFQQLTRLVGVVVLNFWVFSNAHAALTAYPFGRSLDTDQLAKIAAAPTPQAKVAELTALGVSVYKVTLEGGKTEGTFSFLPEAPETLKKQISDDERAHGLTISPYNPCCELKSQAILVATDATEYILMHETAHVLLERALDEKTARENLKIRADEWAIERRFDFNFKYAIYNPAELSGPLATKWRQNLVDYTSDYTAAIAVFTRALLAEEVIADLASLEALRKVNSPALTVEAQSGAADYMNYNLERISTRIGNAAFAADWIRGEIYSEESGVEIPLAEARTAIKRLNQATATANATYEEAQKLVELVKSATSPNSVTNN